MNCTPDVSMVRNTSTVYRERQYALGLHGSGTHTEARPEARVVVACTPPGWNTILVKEVISELCTQLSTQSPLSWIVNSTYRLRLSCSRNILVITPNLENLSCACFTPGFLSGLETCQRINGIDMATRHTGVVYFSSDMLWISLESWQ